MKFLISKDRKPSVLLKLLMANVMVAILFYILLDIFLHAYILGFDIATVKANIFGDEENFIEPILLETLLLQVHIDIFMSLIAVMILSSVYIRYHSEQKQSKIFVHLFLFSALVSPIILLLSFFTNMMLVYLYIFMYALWHILAFIMASLNLKRLWFS